ncbi:ABC transporter substrate-binding protein [Nitrospinota bacterium]
MITRLMQILVFIPIFGIGLLVSAPTFSQEKQDSFPRIRLGASQTATLVVIAHAKGYFREQGLDVQIKFYEAGKLAADALLAGEVDISTSADSAFVSKSFERADIRVIGTLSAENTIALAGRKESGIRKISDLRGKRVGVTRKSSGEYFLGRFLLFHGMSLQDVEIHDLKPSDIVSAVLSGKIDAGFTWEPNIYKIKSKLKERVAVFPGQVGQEFYFLFLAKDQWVAKNSVGLRRFLRAVIRAEKYTQAHEADAKKIICKQFGYGSSYLDYVWPKKKHFVELPQALLPALEAQARWRIRNRLVSKRRMPNYLDRIYKNGLNEVKPSGVTIIE